MHTPLIGQTVHFFDEGSDIPQAAQIIAVAGDFRTATAFTPVNLSVISENGDFSTYSTVPYSPVPVIYPHYRLVSDTYARPELLQTPGSFRRP